MATATLIARHEVEDHATWRVGYDAAEGLRQEHGCSRAQILVDPANRNDITVIHEFPTLEAAQAFAGSSELRDAMGRAGVKGAPRIEIAVEA
jgi:quinol monooxygenase YgiN